MGEESRQTRTASIKPGVFSLVAACACPAPCLSLWPSCSVPSIADWCLSKLAKVEVGASWFMVEKRGTEQTGRGCPFFLQLVYCPFSACQRQRSLCFVFGFVSFCMFGVHLTAVATANEWEKTEGDASNIRTRFCGNYFFTFYFLFIDKLGRWGEIISSETCSPCSPTAFRCTVQQRSMNVRVYSPCRTTQSSSNQPQFGLSK